MQIDFKIFMYLPVSAVERVWDPAISTPHALAHPVLEGHSDRNLRDLQLVQGSPYAASSLVSAPPKDLVRGPRVALMFCHVQSGALRCRGHLR